MIISVIYSQKKLILKNFKIEYFLDCFKLQAKIWGETNAIPASIFTVANSIGGIAIVAIYEDKLIGFILSLPAIFDGHVSQWSCRLAVDEAFRNYGVGRLLKDKQKELLLKKNIPFLMWSFDPLNIRNAHINLNKLGAVIVKFNDVMYPGDNGGRVIVQWNLLEKKSNVDIDLDQLYSYSDIDGFPDLIALGVNDSKDDFQNFSKKVSFLIDNKYQGISLKIVDNVPNYIFKRIL